jgi:hypothetical protein
MVIMKGMNKSMDYPFYNTIKTSGPYENLTEGREREALAAYFLSSTNPKNQTSVEREKYQQALQKLDKIETNAVLQASGINRPLRYGDVNGLLSVTLEAVAKRLEEQHCLLDYDVPDRTICTAAEPRLLQTALIHCLRAVCTTYPDKQSYACVKIHDSNLTIVVKSNVPLTNRNTLSLINEAARLHKGGVVVSGNTVGFSIRKDLPSAIGLFSVPSVKELLNNPLSPVNIGLA